MLNMKSLQTNITILNKGQIIDPNQFENVITAGPNLISYNKTSHKSYIDIPMNDENVNRVVYEAATAVGLIQTSSSSKRNDDASSGNNDKEEEEDLITTEAIFVTTDGSDNCHEIYEPNYCGLRCEGLASLLLNVFNVSQAMSMDQGGSTTMWINGEGINGVVSNSDNTDPGGGGTRAIANGLFVELIPPS